MNTIQVRYNNKYYVENNTGLKSIFDNHLEDIHNDYNIPMYQSELDKQSHLELIFFESKEFLYLKILKTYFNNNYEFDKTEEILTFCINDIKNKDIDINTKYKDNIDRIEKIIDNEEIFFSGVYTSLSKINNAKNLLELLDKIIEFRHVYLKESLDDFADKLNEELIYLDKFKIQYMLKNVFNATFYKSAGFEKMLKSNPDLVLSNFDKSEIGVKNEGKINNVMQVPKFVIEYIEKKKYHEMIGSFQNLKLEGNEYRLIIDFLESSNGLINSNNRGFVYADFLKHIEEILEYENYKIKDLLNYLIKESFFNPVGNRSFYSKNKMFPSNEALILLDYLKLMKENNLEHNKYPKLAIEYNILKDNLDCINSTNENELLNAIYNYQNMITSFKNDKYIMLAPSNIDNMISDGVNLGYLISTKIYDIINSEHKVFFLRQIDNPNKSFIMIEVDNNNNIVDTKGSYNINKDIIELVNNWLENIE